MEGALGVDRDGWGQGPAAAPPSHSEGNPMDRQPMDAEAYEQRAHNGPCFVCAFLQGHPD